MLRGVHAEVSLANDASRPITRWHPLHGPLPGIGRLQVVEAAVKTIWCKAAVWIDTAVIQIACGRHLVRIAISRIVCASRYAHIAGQAVSGRQIEHPLRRIDLIQSRIVLRNLETAVAGGDGAGIPAADAVVGGQAELVAWRADGGPIDRLTINQQQTVFGQDIWIGRDIFHGVFIVVISQRQV